MKKISLPIDPLIGELVASLEAQPNLVLQAAPGSGKTTRVPPALLGARFRGDKEILVLEPRRLAAKMAANRVAEEMDERAGQTVGYQFRFENVGGPKTRIRFLTEGMFIRRLLSDPELKNVAAVVVDEFHERHLQGDVALGSLKRLQQTRRPDLRIVVMSATLDSEAIAAYLGVGGPGGSDDAGPCKIMRTEGKRFEVTTEYRPSDDRYLDSQVASAVRHVLYEGYEGDILVFLPGIAEIRRADDALAELARREKILVVQLYGDLSREEQDRAVHPADRRKIILSTNVAETSLTIEGVRIVIDSGLARIASYSHWSGLPALRTKPVSRASAIQRAGRAGRTAPGHCVRLYSRESFETRAPFEVPEISRADLAQTVLELKTLGVRQIKTFPWFEPPAGANVEAAEKLLYRLNALDEKGALTALGRRMAEMPTHPRLARLVLEGERLGVAEGAATLAALLSEGRPGDGGQVDLMQQFENYRPDFLAARAREQLLRYVRRADSGSGERFAQPGDGTGTEVGAGAGAGAGAEATSSAGSNSKLIPKYPREQSLRRALLTGFPDRIAKRRQLAANLARNTSGTRVEFILSAGGSATIDSSQFAAGPEYFITVDLEERSAQQGQPATKILRSVCAIEPDWLFDLEPLGVVEKTETRWDEARERVEAVTRLMYDSLVLDESPAAASDHVVAERLAAAALSAGLERFCDKDALSGFVARVRFVKEQAGEKEFPEVTPEAMKEALVHLCEGRRSFSELKDAGVFEAITAMLAPEQRQKLERLAPEFVQLPGGRRVRINYEQGKPPWIESRLQDFFGMKAGPSVAGGRVPLTLHLLAPNMRAVQVTSDLSGFWARVYPDLRRELGRRYPRHKWPEDPLTAVPDGPRRR